MAPENAAGEVRALAVLTQPDRLVPGKHACPVDGCGLSAEEHHALTGGVVELMRENRDLRNPSAVEPEPAEDSGIVFDMVDRLVARGYRVRVSIEMPGGNSMTLTGDPDGT